jgi:single-strand DNA-binding protein
MANVNRVTLIGNLTRDPEMTVTNNGFKITKFSLAINHVSKTQDGQKKEETDFIKVTVLGNQAENCAKYLAKGRSVFVEGRLKFNTWEAQDGQKRSSLDVIGSNVQFLGSRSGKAKPQSEDISIPEDDIPF